MHPKILIAEAEPNRARFLGTSLEAAGFQVVQATDSTSAWRVIQTQELAMALVDTDLPGLGNRNILVRLRANPDLAKMPVLMLGESTSSEEAVEWLNMGADNFISRSISAGLLKAEIHAKLRRRQPSSQADN